MLRLTFRLIVALAVEHATEKALDKLGLPRAPKPKAWITRARPKIYMAPVGTTLPPISFKGEWPEPWRCFPVRINSVKVTMKGGEKVA